MSFKVLKVLTVSYMPDGDQSKPWVISLRLEQKSRICFQHGKEKKGRNCTMKYELTLKLTYYYNLVTRNVCGFQCTKNQLTGGYRSTNIVKILALGAIT